MNKSVHVIVVAAGIGERMGSDVPKQYISVHGKAILRHTLDAFHGMEEINNICVVFHPDHRDLFEHSVQGLTILSCHGGDERADSVRKGLAALGDVSDEDTILIHDAARPCLQKSDIQNLIDAMIDHRAATLASPVVDTLRKDDGQTIERAGLWNIQTPQAFQYALIREAHEKFEGDALTDDTQYAAKMGEAVHFVSSSRHNIKITTKDDLNLAEKLLNVSTETRTGMGFDVHAFDDEAADVVRLCGVDVPHDRKLKGHSDADVGLHAITDAILGAIGEGDIGLHFPPSNNDFKNMDSAVFLEHAHDLIAKHFGSIINIDITLICERPKLGDHREKMKVRIAEILSIAPNRVNVKATTTEKLGFTGRGEGIAAQAVVNISIPCEV